MMKILFNFCFVFILLLKISSGVTKFNSNHLIAVDSDFEYGDLKPSGKVVVYRLIGNDMPPLQLRGQLRWNTKYALDNEPHLHGVTKRWILNRIWNSTDYEGIYGDLLAAGVKRRDIVSNCFDLKKYQSYKTIEDKLFYLTAQNEGRDLGITDGRNSGFEWSVILDGNTFITKDSWTIIEQALKKGSDKKMSYMKIPYHRVHSEQSTGWLNKTTTLNTLLAFAPVKGESQVAFQKSAKEMFSLEDTKPEQKDPAKRKGYGARNKSYMFKEGAICSPESKECQCANVPEGNEEDNVSTDFSYAKDCGVILRLWSYPTGQSIETGISADKEEGFFCYLEAYDKTQHNTSLCSLTTKYAAVDWLRLKDSEVAKYKGAKAAACKARMSSVFLTESCVRAQFRVMAQDNVVNALESMISAKYDSSKSLCMQVTTAAKAKTHRHVLRAFDEKTLMAEASAWRNKNSSAYKAIAPLVNDLIKKADSGIKLGPYSVMTKTLLMANQTDKRYYHSVRPYYWPIDLVAKDEVEALKKVTKSDDIAAGFVHREGKRLPGSVIGGPGEELYDRATAWYMLSNVTNLALAWQFTGDKKYADYATKLVDTYILNEGTGMKPSLICAQDGNSLGLIDWKDFYYFLDATVLLEKSGAMSSAQVGKMEAWCSHMVEWYMTSHQGKTQAYMANNHGMFFDLSTLSLALYSNDMDNIDDARTRLHYRLSSVWPLGHYSYDGTPSFEIDRSTSLHFVTVELAGWVHIAMIVDSCRKSNTLLDSSFPSVWEMKHENATSNDPPVLLKAIRWLSKYLPNDPKVYETPMEPKKGMGVNFPYRQEDAYSFDRMLDILHYGIRVYGLNQVFTPQQLQLQSVKAALEVPFYTVKTALMTEYSSVTPDSGTRIWPSLGLPNHYSGGSDGAIWYEKKRRI